MTEKDGFNKMQFKPDEDGNLVGETKAIRPHEQQHPAQQGVSNPAMQMMLSQINSASLNYGIASGRLRSIYDLTLNALEGKDGKSRDLSQIKAILDAIRVLSYEYSRYEVKPNEIKADRRPAVIIRMHALFPDGATGRDSGVALLETLLPLLKAEKVVLLDLGGARVHGPEFWNMVMGNLILQLGKDIVDKYLVLRNVPSDVSKLITIIMHNAHMYATDEEFRDKIDREDSEGSEGREGEEASEENKDLK